MLLNVDYKIVARLISNRITPVLDDIIHPSQMGFMKNRNISHNIRKICDLIKIADQEELEVVIISLDFEKVLDRVEHHAMFKALELYNFGNYLIELVKILSLDFQSCVINAGHTSEWFF